MQYQITNHRTGEVMYEGESDSFRDFVQTILQDHDDFCEADFRRAELESLDFDGCDLTGADFSGAILEQAEFVNADLTGAILVGAHCPFTRFNAATLTGANLTNANLNHARFRNADLTHADLSGAQARACVFAEATLDGTILAGADVTKADFEGVELYKADFDGAIGLASRAESDALLKQIAAIVLSNPDALAMGEWHTCATTHCIGGWGLTLHPHGKELERRYGTYCAVSMVLPTANHMFFEDDETALNWLRRKSTP